MTIRARSAITPYGRSAQNQTSLSTIVAMIACKLHGTSVVPAAMLKLSGFA